MSQPASPSPHYEVLAELGRGTTGVVYKARQVALNRLVALKVPLLDSPPGRSEKCARFLREAQVLATVTLDPDPHFPTLHEVGQYQGQPYYAREFVEGHTLGQRATEGTLDLRNGLAVLATVGRALDRVHRRGFAHRNLHPSNVLIGAGAVPKLIGFGWVGLLEGSALLPPGGAGASAEVDVRALLGMLDWMAVTLREALPASLESIRRPGSVGDPAAFAEALENWTHDDP